MANCCSYTPCQELVTVEYLRAFPLQTACTTINDAQEYDACCGRSSGDNYVVSKNFITLNNIPIRDIKVNPNEDIDGFTISDAQEYDACCGNLSADNHCISKSMVTFGTTVLKSSALSFTATTGCNPTYTVVKTDAYDRKTYECNSNNGELVSTTEEVTKDTVICSDVSFTKTVETSANNFKITFSADEITSSTERCGVSITSTTTPTVEGYEIAINLEEPIEIPCTGQSNVLFATIDGDECNEVEIDTVSGAESARLENNGIIIDFGHSNNELTTTVGITFNVEGQTLTLEASYTRTPCGYSPDIEPNNSCGVFWYDESWNGVDNVSYHPYTT